MRRTAGFLWVSLLLLTSIAHAQEDRGTILGRITDPTGAALVGAAISVENVETGVKSASTTNDQGSYLIPYLPAGRYRVTVESPGFKRAENPEITLRIQQVARLDFRLELGNVSEQLTVNASAPLLATDDATLGQVVDRTKIVELPISGRNLSALTLLGTG